MFIILHTRPSHLKPGRQPAATMTISQAQSLPLPLRLRMTATERVAYATRLQRIGGPLRDLFRWIASPEPLIRWLKRHQQRRANGDGKTAPRSPAVRGSARTRSMPFCVSTTAA